MQLHSKHSENEDTSISHGVIKKAILIRLQLNQPTSIVHVPAASRRKVGDRDKVFPENKSLFWFSSFSSSQQINEPFCRFYFCWISSWSNFLLDEIHKSQYFKVATNQQPML